MERAKKFGKEQNQQRNVERKPEDIDHENGKRSTEEGIPVEDSPYVNYKDLEDYKFKAYGAEGHEQPESGRRGAGATNSFGRYRPRSF
ncbi:hypothetical protein K2173_014610 [Erythroxylum novogranatense]|uniref:Uncharacterized protein n=1 Tax=Erythroxylum novogranatense TaxID=1862640 RepID=A0AAV8TGS1_9ROSI|nr:hypothetical protein K2173_014610 [Erythroxylum novogranatense]